MSVSEKLALKVREAVEVSGIGQSTLYEMMASGDLPFVKIGASRRIMTEDLQALLQRHRVTEAA